MNGRRAEVLRVLREADDAMAVAEVADRLGVHVNTVRFHLDDLVRSGQVVSEPGRVRTAGRPPRVFRAVQRMDPSGERHYRMLSEILVAGLGEGIGSRRTAAAAGRAWGRTHASDRADLSVTDRLVTLLADADFAPERRVTSDDSTEVSIGLHNCPFLELAEGRPDVVCSVHRGLMEGALEAWGSEATVESLEAFVEPDLCLTRIVVPGGS